MPRASTAAHDRVIASVTRPETGPARSLGAFGLDVPLDTRVKERATGLLPVSPTLLRLALVARAQVPGICRPVWIAAFTTVFHRGLDHVARSSRPLGWSLVVVARRTG